MNPPSVGTIWRFAGYKDESYLDDPSDPRSARTGAPFTPGQLVQVVGADEDDGLIVRSNNVEDTVFPEELENP